MSLSPTAQKLLAAEIKEMVSENERLKALAKQLLDWNAKHPKTSLVMSSHEIAAMELELDDIITGFENAVHNSK